MTTRRVFLVSFSALPVPLFAFIILLAVRARSSTAEADARLGKDLASLESSAPAECADAVEFERETLVESASDLKKTAKQRRTYPHGYSQSGKSRPAEFDFSPYGWMRYGSSGR